jgi:hypothetical protein
MEQPNFQPGERVVDLGALAVSASVASGAVAGAWIRWWVDGGWAAPLIGLVAGGLLGVVVGRLWAQARYRRSDETTIVRVGPGALGHSVPAALVGGVVTALLIALLSSLFVAALAQALPLFAIAVGCGVVVGIAFACLVSLG